MSKCKNKLYEGEKINNFRDLVAIYEKRHSNNIAFIYKENPNSKEHIKISYGKFANDIKALGTSLLKLGLRGKKVALISPNRYEWCVSYLAVATSDITIVPLDKSLPDNEIKNLIIRSKVDCVIFDKKYENVFNNFYDDKTSNLKYFICMDNTTSNPNFLNYLDLINNGVHLLTDGDKQYDEIKINPNEVSILLFTSGTTSISKCVALSQSNICADMYGLSQIAKINEDDVCLSFLPLHHTFESTCTFLYGTFCGISIAFCDGLKYIQKNLIEFKISIMVSVPLMLEIMYKKIEKGIDEQGKSKLIKFMKNICNFLLKFKIDIRRLVFKEILNKFGGNLRLIIAGGAPMSKETIQGFLDFGINLLQGYGLTETSPVLAGENDKYKHAGSVGFPLPGIDIKINNPNEEGIGEIIAKGPTIMHGYVDNEEATKSVLKNGWFYTGDLGKFDKNGFLYVTGRKKDVIVLKNGKNIFPEELEILINKLPYVSESFVYGKPGHREGDLDICAKIVYNLEAMKELYPDNNSNEYYNIIFEDVKNNINHSMPAYKTIREIIVTDEPLIKTTTQKIKRHEELKKILDI